jgi:hypothetical protein
MTSFYFIFGPGHPLAIVFCLRLLPTMNPQQIKESLRKSVIKQAWRDQTPERVTLIPIIHAARATSSRYGFRGTQSCAEGTFSGRWMRLDFCAARFSNSCYAVNAIGELVDTLEDLILRAGAQHNHPR